MAERVFQLGASLTLPEVAECRRRLSEEPPAIRLAGGDIERIDTAGLQLLLAYARHLQASGSHLAWESASDVLAQAARQLGIADSLGLAGLEAGK